ncbi:MAG: molybdopterin-guanine dinucleotide biosynthesis protein B [Desulfobacterota bacterium]|nr:molybdopterin-guanine dinucleotide biosynthesis protein B [Thermodesulfobacteriota bacterium]
MNSSSALIRMPHAIVVSGLRSGIGKTLLAEHIVELVPDIAAIKITVHDGPTVVSAADADIMVQGKDTWRLRSRGAFPVVWVRACETEVGTGLQQALPLISGRPALLIEGNSVLQFIQPALALFICDSGILSEDIKHSRIEALRKATAVINNVRDTAAQGADRVTARCKTLNPQAPISSLSLTDSTAVRHLLRQLLERAGIGVRTGNSSPNVS